MTPVAFLVLFCAAMAAIALGRLAIDRSRDPVDIGTALVVAGITLGTVLWAALEEGLLTTGGRIGVAFAGATFAGLGLVLIARYWDAADGPDRDIDRRNS